MLSSYSYFFISAIIKIFETDVFPLVHFTNKDPLLLKDTMESYWTKLKFDYLISLTKELIIDPYGNRTHAR